MNRRLQDFRLYKACLWLKSAPTRDTSLSNSQFAIAFRFRFGMKPTPNMPQHCICKEHTDLQVSPWHLLDCPLVNAERVKRHNLGLRALDKWISSIGGHAIIEPQKLIEFERLRPDCDAVIGGSRIISDFTVLNPLAKSSLKKAQVQLAVAEEAATEKKRKYEAKLAHLGGAFYPLAMEATGGMSLSCASALAEHIKAGQHSGVFASRRVVYGIHATLCATVQRGNADIVSMALSKLDSA
jgi:hypothetical protein